MATDKRPLQVVVSAFDDLFALTAPRGCSKCHQEKAAITRPRKPTVSHVIPLPTAGLRNVLVRSQPWNF
jgi:hypothetical protein